MSVTTIELARPDDLGRITWIVNRAAETGSANVATEPEQVDRWLAEWQRTRVMYPWLVARSAGKVLGFAKAGPHRPRGAYQWTAELSIYIDELSHGRRLGTALYEVLIPLLRAQGYVTLIAGVVTGHVPSERLHARSGFVRCGTFHRAGWKRDHWHDVGYWELLLQAPLGAPDPIQPVAEVWTARAAGHLGRATAERPTA